MQIFESKLLFHEVQMQQIFPDGKTFVDCLPLRTMEDITADFLAFRLKNDFDLAAFVAANFDLPKENEIVYHSNSEVSINMHLENLWDILRRQKDKIQVNNTLIALPNDYIVPGGRFREIYYWDSYFTMLGLHANKKTDLMEAMVNNFAYLIEQIGYIPNGNRTYYIGRSQPPFFALMVKLLSQVKGKSVLEKYLPALEKELLFWQSAFSNRKISIDDNILYRYFDSNDTPRPESYREDVELSHQSYQNPSDLYRNIRAAAESGWDFSHRWFTAEDDFSTIHTTDIAPVDLYCLIYSLEKLLLEAKNMDTEILSSQATQTISKYFWNEAKSFFTDYDFVKKESKQVLSLAGVFPLFFNLATSEQAAHVAALIKKDFLKRGGLSTTLKQTPQQWDAPNGWAPLQWITFVAMKNYGYHAFAAEIRQKWTNTCEKVYESTGKMTEKYNVWSEDAAASGGEYPNQDGFGWTNGVYLAMKYAED